MTPKFTRGPHGRTIRCPGGYHAFVPAPLPPGIEWSAEIATALSRADRAIGRLAGEGWRFRNPNLLIRPFVRREAVLSSRIEGTQTTLAELLVSGAGATPGAMPADLREVRNYVTALEYGLERLDTLPLSLRLIREIHERLMSDVRGGVATPGEFRRSQNWIGPAGCELGQATYVPPPADELMGCLGQLEHFLHGSSLPPLVNAALAHAQFEAIHPFLDGNGRVGRLLITLLLVERNVLPSPLLYLSAYFEATRQQYYAHLLAVTQSGAWEDWLIYFLEGVSTQSADAVARIRRLVDLFDRAREKLTAIRSARLERALELFVENPFRTVGGLAQEMGVAYTTARRAISRLEAAGIVSLVADAKRNRIYCADGVLDALRSRPVPEPAASNTGKDPGANA